MIQIIAQNQNLRLGKKVELPLKSCSISGVQSEYNDGVRVHHITEDGKPDDDYYRMDDNNGQASIIMREQTRSVDGGYLYFTITQQNPQSLLSKCYSMFGCSKDGYCVDIRVRGDQSIPEELQPGDYLDPALIQFLEGESYKPPPTMAAQVVEDVTQPAPPVKAFKLRWPLRQGNACEVTVHPDDPEDLAQLHHLKNKKIPGEEALERTKEEAEILYLKRAKKEAEILRLEKILYERDCIHCEWKKAVFDEEVVVRTPDGYRQAANFRLEGQGELLTVPLTRIRGLEWDKNGETKIWHDYFKKHALPDTNM